MLDISESFLINGLTSEWNFHFDFFLLFFFSEILMMYLIKPAEEDILWR